MGLFVIVADDNDDDAGDDADDEYDDADDDHLRPPSLRPLRPSLSSLCLHVDDDDVDDDVDHDDDGDDNYNDDYVEDVDVGDDDVDNDDDKKNEFCLSRQRSPKESRTWIIIINSSQKIQEQHNVANEGDVLTFGEVFPLKPFKHFTFLAKMSFFCENDTFRGV